MAARRTAKSMLVVLSNEMRAASVSSVALSCASVALSASMRLDRDASVADSEVSVDYSDVKVVSMVDKRPEVDVSNVSKS